MTTRPSIILFLAVFSLCLTTGCKKSNPNAPASITGKITFNGAPLTKGTIAFHTENGTFIVSLRDDGSYISTDMPVGEAKVAIETESANPNKPPAPKYGPDTAGASGADMYGKGSGKKSPAVTEGSKPESTVPANESTNRDGYVKIPRRYSNPDESKLTVSLGKGETKKDFALTD